MRRQPAPVASLGAENTGEASAYRGPAMPPANAVAVARRRRWVWALGYTALVVGAAVAVIGPSALAFSDGFIAWAVTLPDATVSPGDHLQMTYYLWLWQHALTTFDHLPWFDPFQFAASGHAGAQPFGWPLVVVSLPVSLVAGPVAAYNVLVLVAFVACAGATYGLARQLGASASGAAVAGIAFAFAPFRLVQAATHVNALLAPLLPLLLLFAERAMRGEGRAARRAAWAAVAVHLSIMASGELHLAVFATGLLAVYVAIRLPGTAPADRRRLLVPGVALLAGTAVVAALMYAFVLEPSVAAGGRSLDEAASFAPRPTDLVERDLDWPDFERYAYPGAVIALLAGAGAVTALIDRRRRLLGAGLVVLAVGTVVLALAPALDRFPALVAAYRAVPFLSFSRVPGRILVVTALALAVLAAFAIDLVRSSQWRVAAAVLAAAALLLDGPDGVFERNPAGPTALAAVAPGATVLDLPPFDPGAYSGAVYTFLLTRAPGPRVGGYSPFVRPEARAAQQRTVALAQLPVEPCRWQEVVRDFGIDHVAVHLDLYGPLRDQWPGDGPALADALAATPGFTPVAEAGQVAVFAVDPDRLPCDA